MDTTLRVLKNPVSYRISVSNQNRIRIVSVSYLPYLSFSEVRTLKMLGVEKSLVCLLAWVGLRTVLPVTVAPTSCCLSGVAQVIG